MKKQLKILGIVGCMLLLTGCVENERVESKNLSILDTEVSSKLDFTHEFEDIKLKTNYSAGNYDIGKWLITDSKTLNLNMAVENLPEGTEVFIEHVHADISLASKLAVFNGTPQDSMDDSYHGFSQDGFYVTQNYSYEEVFAIEGYSETLINGWTYANSYGYISEDRLTEKNLVRYGETYGNKVQVIYNLNIKNKGDKYFHTKTIKDEFYIKTTYKDVEEE